MNQSTTTQGSSGRYSGRLLCRVLCQGAASRYVDHTNGVKDFDVWAFTPSAPMDPPSQMARDGRLRPLEVRPPSRRSAPLPGPPCGPHGPVTPRLACGRSRQCCAQLPVCRADGVGQGTSSQGRGTHRPLRPRRRDHLAAPALTTLAARRRQAVSLSVSRLARAARTPTARYVRQIAASAAGSDRA